MQHQHIYVSGNSRKTIKTNSTTSITKGITRKDEMIIIKKIMSIN